VALMTDLLDIGPDDAVLEIGTGLGYQSAILAQLARKVYSIEIIEELGRQAKQRLRRQGCTNVDLKIANGYHERLKFDRHEFVLRDPSHRCHHPLVKGSPASCLAAYANIPLPIGFDKTISQPVGPSTPRSTR
jgi:protein-L-isoaspartate O-methyltransferase